ncbi:MAG: hypothetical protein GOVbin1630_8 [Prokaryotic dsDNA virus sp.]|nr:MAG: hypothetical protein GOVbin1630_8 [Prokaryotic dsDNA virus sp.]|tara:strand:+ start:19074 stop:19655 length:582 start_codon:yes stop_codon:yes gene_type:complete
MPSRRSAAPPVTIKPYAGSGEAGYGQNGPFSDSSKIGYDGDYYRIKVLQARFEKTVDLIDCTGEFTGNLTGSPILNPVYKSSSMPRGRVSFTGHVPDGEAVGFANLGNNDGTRNTIDCEFHLGIGDRDPAGVSAPRSNVLKFRAVIESMVIDWNLDNPYIGISITGIVTGSEASLVGTTDESPILESVSTHTG